MTVKLETTIQRWIGTSQDVKPFVGQDVDGDGIRLKATDLRPGSSFMETDTGLIYRWDGEAWQVHVPQDELAPVLGAMLLVLKQIEEHTAVL